MHFPASQTRSALQSMSLVHCACATVAESVSAAPSPTTQKDLIPTMLEDPRRTTSASAKFAAASRPFSGVGLAPIDLPRNASRPFCAEEILADEVRAFRRRSA